MSVFPFPFCGSSPNKRGVISSPPHKRDEERDSFGVTDGLNINIWYKLPILIESAYDDADFRMHIVSF